MLWRRLIAALTVPAALAAISSVIAATPRPFPDTSARIAVLADQLPSSMTAAQVRFAATHYAGTQKLTLDVSRALRDINPAFLVLHYHLAMWQSAPTVAYILDGTQWGNDYPEVDRHETWFWHNAGHQRVASHGDGKLLMNVSDPGFRQYLTDSLIRQVQAGDYDGVFLDSASPALLQGEARTPEDARLFGTGVRTNTFEELRGKSWIAAWEDWIVALDRSLAEHGIPLIPNVGGLITTWDNTNYALTAGAFSEGFLDPRFGPTDWHAAADQTLDLVRRNKIVILENYLPSEDDVARRRFLVASYLLVKGSRTYLEYYAKGPLEWYPEWDLDLGAAQQTAITIDDLSWNGVYRREFANGVVLVNPGNEPVRVRLGAAFQRVALVGGGAVPADGRVDGRIETQPVTELELPAQDAAIVVR